ncbi:hypothetical protein WJX79_001325 [Trebouxia sp. C0005]
MVSKKTCINLWAGLNAYGCLEETKLDQVRVESTLCRMLNGFGERRFMEIRLSLEKAGADATRGAEPRLNTLSGSRQVCQLGRYRADDGPKQHAAVYLLQVPIVLLAMITRWTSLHSNCQLWRSRADSKLLLVRCPVVNRALEVKHTMYTSEAALALVEDAMASGHFRGFLNLNSQAIVSLPALRDVTGGSADQICIEHGNFMSQAGQIVQWTSRKECKPCIVSSFFALVSKQLQVHVWTALKAYGCLEEPKVTQHDHRL